MNRVLVMIRGKIVHIMNKRWSAIGLLFLYSLQVLFIIIFAPLLVEKHHIVVYECLVIWLTPSCLYLRVLLLWISIILR